MSNNLDLEQMAEDQDGAEIVHNDSNAQLDAAITEFIEIDATFGDTLITDEQWRQNIEFHIIYEGSGFSPNRTVTVPSIRRLVMIYCPSTNTDSVDIVRGATSVTIMPGQSFFIRTDGSADGLLAHSMGGNTDDFVLKSGDTMTGALTMTVAGSAVLTLQGDGGTSSVIADSYQASSSSSAIVYRKARGTLSSPANVITNDNLMTFTSQGYGGGAFRAGGRIQTTVNATTPSATDMESQLAFQLAAAGSASLTEALRIRHATGLAMFSNVVIDENRIHRMRSTTIAGLITSSAAGKIGHVSDSNGGVGSFMMDTGGGYREVGSTGLKRLTTDAAATHTPLTDARHVRDNATLTANRNYTLAVTNVLNGYEVLVSRNGSSGGFTRDVRQADGSTLIKSLADNTYGRFIWDNTAALWYLAETGNCS